MLKLARKARKVGGRWIRWNKDAVRDDLRAEFLREIATSAPEVLNALKEDVWPLYQKLFPHDKQGIRYIRPFGWPEDFRTRVMEYCLRHHLVYSSRAPAWVMEQLAFTLGFWSNHPEVTLNNPLGWGVRGGYSDLKEVDYLAVEVQRRIERSIYESDEEFEKRVCDDLKEIIRPQLEALSRRIAELSVLPRKRRREHFVWTVLHQIQRWSFDRIATKYHVSRYTVRNEVVELKKWIGLSLPRGRH